MKDPAAPSPNGVLVSTRSSADKPPLIRLSSLLDEFDAEATAAHENLLAGQQRGSSTGSPQLDEEIGGFAAPGVHVIDANTGAGKTAFCLQMATLAKHPTLYVTCEMAPLRLLQRLIARVTNTFLRKLIRGELPPTEAHHLAERAIASAPYACLLDGTFSYADPHHLLEASEIAREHSGSSSEHFLMVIDSVHSWIQKAPGNAPEYELINAGLDELLQLSQRLKCAIWLLAERRRSAMDGGLNSTAGSRRFEYLAETVISMDPKGQFNPATGTQPIELTLDKNRAGITGKKLKYLFHGRVQRFEDAP